MVAKTTRFTQRVLAGIRRTFGLNANLQRIDLSSDPFFVRRVCEIAGFFLNPTASIRAVAFCVDEAGQLKTLNQRQPTLSMPPREAEGRSLSACRHQAASLFSALNRATQGFPGNCRRQHHHQEFLRFLENIEREVPGQFDIHIVVDNCKIPKAPRLTAWLTKRRRYHMHFSSSSTCWANEVECLLARIAEQPLRHGALESIRQLEMAVHDYIGTSNGNPKPFVWTATQGRSNGDRRYFSTAKLDIR